MKSWWWGIGVGLLVSSCQLGTRWQMVQGDRFQVNFPGTPQQEQRTLETGVGEVATQAWGVNRPRGSYAVVFTDYDQPVVRLAHSPLVWEQLKAQAQQRVQGRVTQERQVTLGNHPGREMIVTIPPERLTGGGVAKVQFYFVGQRVYGLYAIVPQEHQQDLAPFFDSFQVTNNPVPAPAN
ncbi:hypothetical protein GlitD10_2710 [Gloeomargarita lithophora Alchichica-D10]|uniref:Lipoprotein n=1 Tax=Gloeomargarita lithophora Alchichica-D10 TaxID=1188229 RepID=A0A1J0AGJ9_9CYAN|nr:hypothetical protein [Gloeomargarita lithophora]APB35053.1 hypothetical protein GlitD10_2710 [Gloeomargarita lithophora Alchichica-D10]